MVGVEETKSEDLLILFGVHPDVTDINAVIKSLDRYFRSKQQNDVTDRFNFIAFEENGPIYYEDFIFEPQYIIKALKDLKNNLVHPNITGGILVAITFIIDVFKIVGGKCFRLLILTDRNAPPLVNIDVIQNLMDQVADFPFFIDFISIGRSDPRIELRLMKFAKKNNGEVMFAKNEKEFDHILLNLDLKKKLYKKIDSDTKYISPENELFFENLAEDLWVIEDNERKNKRCQICGENDGEFVKCPKCDPIVHPECLAQWAKMSNIGLPHVFRCMNCYNLLRLPKKFVLDVQSGKRKRERKITISTCDQNSLLRTKQNKNFPQLKKNADQMMNFQDDDGWGDEDFIVRNDAELEIQFCGECGTLNFPESIKCSKCGRFLH